MQLHSSLFIIQQVHMYMYTLILKLIVVVRHDNNKK